ncbi:hypothetical protein HaLaN_29778 [Haematococcus lacustris]|uniref:Uncharacterized protein n=1 Tax=Haematococcus lacustris TaxID=44745 RepID=A0A6A0AD87_HAELA|nr:hypothetical protein HaLaN_29778 [Haematococcus lacustris]
MQAYASVVSDALDIRTTAMDARMSGRWSNPNAGIDVEMAMLNPIKSLLGSQQTSVDPADFTTAMSAMTPGVRALQGAAVGHHWLCATTPTTRTALTTRSTSIYRFTWSDHTCAGHCDCRASSGVLPAGAAAGRHHHPPAPQCQAAALPDGPCAAACCWRQGYPGHHGCAGLQQAMGECESMAAKAMLLLRFLLLPVVVQETMPAGVMEVSMKLHDDLVRRLALDSSGYEWATEGDSRGLCYPAAGCAAEVQAVACGAGCTGQPWPAAVPCPCVARLTSE